MSTLTPDVHPYRVAPDTWVLPQVEAAPPAGLVYMNSLVINAAEPIIVDTGAPVHREVWLEAAGSVTDLDEVRWIFLSHDDRDHSGNLMHVLEACPKATLLTTFFALGRMAEEFDIPMDRVRLLNEDESFHAGDRTLTAIRPPLFDSPVTRGLYDHRTGVLWGVDAFSAIVPHAAEDASDLTVEDFTEGFLLAHSMNSPWHEWLDARRWLRHVDRVRALEPTAIAACHGPALYGRTIDHAFELLAQLPDHPRWREPSHDDLLRMLAVAEATEPAPLVTT